MSDGKRSEGGRRGAGGSGQGHTVGPYGADVHAGVFGPVRLSLRRDRVGAPHGRDRVREGRDDLRAEERRGPQVLVADGDEHRRPEVLSRPHRHARARNLRPPAHRARRRDDHRLRREGRLLPHRRRPRRLPRRARRDPREPGRLLQFARLVQRRHRAQAPGLGLLHQLLRRLDGLDPLARQDRGHALQVRLGHRIEPLLDPRLARDRSRPAAPPPARSPS